MKYTAEDFRADVMALDNLLGGGLGDMDGGAKKAKRKTAKRSKSPKRKSPKRKSPKRKSPKRKSPKRKSPVKRRRRSLKGGSPNNNNLNNQEGGRRRRSTHSSQHGGKKRSSSKGDHRTFVLDTIDGKSVDPKHSGTYKISEEGNPGDAARKAFASICRGQKKKYHQPKGAKCSVEFTIRESTQGSSKKIYGPYRGEQVKLAKPEVKKFPGGVEFVRKYKYEVKLLDK